MRNWRILLCVAALATLANSATGAPHVPEDDAVVLEQPTTAMPLPGGKATLDLGYEMFAYRLQGNRSAEVDDVRVVAR